MGVLISLIVLLVVLNAAIYPLCKIQYRSEDAARIADGSLKVKGGTQGYPVSCWILSASMAVISALFHSTDVAIAMIGLSDLVVLILFVIAAFNHNTYYTTDDERLTYVKHGKIEWSHTWEEIKHARKRIVSTGKSFIVYYDITTKDGVQHRSLPADLGNDLKKRVYINRKVERGTIMGLVIFIVVIIMLLLFFLVF